MTILDPVGEWFLLIIVDAAANLAADSFGREAEPRSISHGWS
jgi:hypothetical protein